MRLITARTIDEFAKLHPITRSELGSWVTMIRAANWTSPTQAVQTSLFHTRSIANKRLVFKLKGNDYRIVVSVRYASATQQHNGVVIVQFIGTHAEYDNIDATTVSYTP